MIAIAAAAEASCYVTSDHHLVAGMTQEGWDLIFMYQETMCSTMMETEQGPAGYINKQVVRPMSTTYFVLRKSASCVIEEATAKVTAAEKSMREADSARVTALAELKRLQGEVKASAETARIYTERNTRLTEERDRESKSKRKLEEDIAKIRVAIGAKAFAEILPP